MMPSKYGIGTESLHKFAEAQKAKQEAAAKEPAEQQTCLGNWTSDAIQGTIGGGTKDVQDYAGLGAQSVGGSIADAQTERYGWAGTYQNPHQHTCPACGCCPCCGRGGYQPYIPPTPYWLNQNIYN